MSLQGSQPKGAPIAVPTVHHSPCERVADAASRRPRDALGEVPIAFIVAADDSGIDEDDLRSRCPAALSYFKVPAEFIAVPGIPRTGSGRFNATGCTVHNQSSPTSPVDSAHPRCR
ncbi:hypothetical protein [Rhodococcus jostii]|uniref:AMP-binding enzyme n=1 Tax=Rhodococcus jostii TaxID=132919 RepID=UPI00364A146D